MPQKDFGDDIISEHGSWNVAQHYAELKIMKPLYLCDEYETIATFGHVDFIDEMLSNFSPDVLKIRGFKRLIKTLILLINNCKFAVKGKQNTQLVEYSQELKRYYKTIEVLFKYKTNQKNRSKELVIIPEKYDKVLERVIEIKSLINEPLNKYDLIFTYIEPFDPKKAKELIKKGLIERG